MPHREPRPDPARPGAPRPAPRRNGPAMQTVLVLAVVALVAAAVVATGLSVHLSSRRALARLSDHLTAEVASRVRAELRPWLDAAVTLDEQNRRWIEADGMPSDDALVAQFARQLRTVPAVSYVQVGREDGSFVGVERNEDGTLQLERTDPQRAGKGVYRLDDDLVPREELSFVHGYDARTRPWYRAARDDRPAWSEVYQFSSRQSVRLGITAVLPIHGPDGRRIGVVGADLVLSHLSAMLRSPSYGEGAEVALVERSGLLVASSAGPVYRVGADGRVERTPIAEADDALRAAAAALGALDPLRDTRTVRTSRGWYSATPLAEHTGPDWILVTAVPPELLLGDVPAEERRSVLVALVILALAAAVTAVVARMSTRSLGALAHAATRFSRGDLSHPVPVAGIAELDALARALETMRTAIAQSLQDAEHARQIAEAGSRAKSAFLAAVSHELRTPLNAILGYSELLAETLYEDPDPLAAERDLARIRDSARHLLALIGDLLDLARLESGKLELRLEGVAVGPLLVEVVGAVRPAVEVRGNTLDLQLAAGTGWVRADRGRLRQVLINLLGNAGKFTDHGRVTLVAARHGDHVRFEVRDTGLGIEPERLTSMFEPFTRAPGAAGREGAGLGLAIVRHLVDAMGGTVSVHSELGKGSIFAVRLPVHDPGAQTLADADSLEGR